MAAHRYWRIVGLLTDGGTTLELSELRLYADGLLADAGVDVAASLAPDAGSLADLQDDSAADVAAWSASKFASPGFSFSWDFGSGGDVEVSHIRLGAGTSALTYPRDLTVQYSDDGSYWEGAVAVAFATYPGALTLTEEPHPATGGADPYFSDVKLLMHGDGVDGAAAFVDDGPGANSITVLGTVVHSAAHSKFGGTSVYMDGLSNLSIPVAAGFGTLSGDFTIESWIYLTDGTKPQHQFVDARTSGATGAPWALYLLDTSGAYKLSWFNGTDNAGSITVPINAWVHIAASRVSGTLRLFVDGVVSGAFSITGTQAGTTSTPLYIGGKDSPTYKFKGHFDDLRITVGVGRYTAGFTPPVAALPGSSGGAYDVPFVPVEFGARRARALVDSTLFVGAEELPGATAAHGFSREFTFFDAYHGGFGRVYGTVKEDATPSDLPLHRKVLLIDEASQVVIRQTWSDAITGNYEFRGVRSGVKYTVLAYDYMGIYRAVVADAQDAEVVA